MIIAFLLGLIAITAAIIRKRKSLDLTLEWLVSYIKNRIAKSKGKKVVFAEIRELIDDDVKEKINYSESISVTELEKLCDETPYVSAIYDEENDTVYDYEGFQKKSKDAQFEEKMKENDGMIIVTA